MELDELKEQININKWRYCVEWQEIRIKNKTTWL